MGTPNQRPEHGELLPSPGSTLLLSSLDVAAYAQAVAQFLRWCEVHGLVLATLEPTLIGAYVEQLGERLVSKPSVKHLRGNTPLLSAKGARALLDSIDAADVVGLRDRALNGVMVFSLARISAVASSKEPRRPRPMRDRMRQSFTTGPMIS